MGKKRTRARGRSAKEESSVDLMSTTCTHMRKGADPSWLRKSSAEKGWDTCEACTQDRESTPESGDDEEQEILSVWMCLKCGHRGCGRFSKNQHAIKHYETPRSDPHCLVLNLDSWSVWCYICDQEIFYSDTGQLAQLISNIKKQILGETRQKNASADAKEEPNTSGDAMQENEAEKEQEKKEEEPKGNKEVLKQNGHQTQASAVPVRGLSNLGNTCFFNAVLQNLSQTWLLREQLRDLRDEEKTLLITPPSSSDLDPLQVRLPRPGALTLAMCRVLNEIQETKRGVVTPQELFTQVCKKAERFKGFQQQDSQELLRYLLDGMRTEENGRATTGVLNALKSLGRTTEPEQKKLVKEYESTAGLKSFVELVFGGELTSTVMCTECKTISMVTEVFLDLSLPVSEESYRKKKAGVQQNKSEGELPTSKDEDMPTGSGSKYQQKKAKKQAKKQAKIQRRQQKQGVKLTLENPGEAAPPEAPPPSANGFLETEKQEMEEDDEEEEAELSESVKMLSISDDPQSAEEEELDPGAESGAESEFVVVNMDQETAFSSLSSRAAPRALDSSVESSLYLFTQSERLENTNSLMCITCSRQRGAKKVYTEAMKQMLISSPPPVLTLHLKRFQQVGYRVSKVNRHVQFPQVLDLGPYCSAKCKGVEKGQTQLLYSLYGIVEHSGTMRSGHYTAFVKARPPAHTSTGSTPTFLTDDGAPPRGSWFHVSDSSVHPVTEAQVLASQAYLLFYERIS